MKTIRKLIAISLLAASAAAFAQTSTTPPKNPVGQPATTPTGQPANPVVVPPTQPTATNPAPSPMVPLQPTTLPSSPPTSTAPPPNPMGNPTGTIEPGTNPPGSITNNPAGNPAPGSLPPPTNPALGAAGRQPPMVDGQAATVFSSLDQNHKGYLNKSDVASHQYLSSHFQQCDTNGDGQLSSQEVASCTGGH